MDHAIVAVEDKRFWTDPGVDLRGLVRAAVADLTGSATQGGSTIAEQFVKNVLASREQPHDPREAARGRRSPSSSYTAGTSGRS